MSQSKEYTDNNPQSPRNTRSINARIQELKESVGNGISVFDYLRLRYLRGRIQKGDFKDDLGGNNA